MLDIILEPDRVGTRRGAHLAGGLLLIASLVLGCTDENGTVATDQDADSNSSEEMGDVTDDAVDGTSPDTAGTPDSSATVEVTALGPFMVPMRDEASLHTQVFVPQDIPAGGLSTILMRTPYRFAVSDAYYRQTAEFHAARGYAFVLQDCRGRSGSEGTFVPFEGEVEDGQDTTAWIVSQDWSNGIIGTIGGSYNGFTAIAAAVDNPAVVAIIADDPAEDLSWNRRDGALSIFPLTWLYLLDHADWPPDSLVAQMSNALDLTGLDEATLGRTDATWRDYVASSGTTDDFFLNRSVKPFYGQICAALLIIKSRTQPWEDPVNVWNGFRAEGCEEYADAHRLVITAEGHTDHLSALTGEGSDLSGLMFDWLDGWLLEADVGLEEISPVLFRAETDTEYRSAEAWPAANRDVSFYLANPNGASSNGHLNDSPMTGTGSDELTFQPDSDDPCGDYPYFSYLSGELAESLYVAGSPQLEIWVSTMTPDADISAIVYEYNPAHDPELAYVVFGTLRLNNPLTESIEPGEPTRIEVNMHSIAYEFSAGSQIAVAVTGTLCGYAENPHTGQPASAQTTWENATYRFHHGEEHPSRLVLPQL